MNLTDSHAHIDYDLYDSDRLQVLERARAAGVSKIVNICLGPEAEKLERGFQFFSDDPNVYFAVGVHPHDAARMDNDTVPFLKQCARRNRVVAIGEIGLDFYYGHSPKEAQLSRFEELLSLALEVKLPVTIHMRDAFEDTYRITSQLEIFKQTGGVLHCFTGSAEEAKKFLDLGAFISFSGIVTFKKAAHVHQAAKEVPLERMLIETDAPFLSPEPYRGKRNEPSYVLRTAETIASLKGISVEEVAQTTSLNAARLFRL